MATPILENARISGKSTGFNPYISVQIFVRDNFHMAQVIITGKLPSGGMDGQGNYAVYKYNPVEVVDREGNGATVEFPFFYRSKPYRCVLMLNPNSCAFVIFDENGVPVVDLGEAVPGTFSIA